MIADWLLSSIDPSRPHNVSLEMAWHGRLMVIAWGVLLPAGVLAARFFKIMPGQDWPTVVDNRTWWRTHLTTQYLGGIAVVVAIYLSWDNREGGSANFWHRNIGWTVVGLAAIQFASGWLRGTHGGPTHPRWDGSIAGDHYDMTLRRRIFEGVHKSCGYIALVFAVFSIMSGLWIANAPKWMVVMLVGWWVVLISMFVALHRMGPRRVSTYQAIWGPGEDHPGNRRIPPKPHRPRQLE